MAQVIYDFRPNPLAGVADAVGILGKALAARWENQAKIEDQVAVGKALYDMLAGKLTQEALDQYVQSMKTPEGIGLLNNVLAKKALEKDEIKVGPPGSHLYRGAEKVAEVPFGPQRYRPGDYVVPGDGREPFQIPQAPMTEAEKIRADQAERRLALDSEYKKFLIGQANQPSGRYKNLRLMAIDFGLKPTMDNLEKLNKQFYNDGGDLDRFALGKAIELSKSDPRWDQRDAAYKEKKIRENKEVVLKTMVGGQAGPAAPDLSTLPIGKAVVINGVYVGRFRDGNLYTFDPKTGKPKEKYLLK